MNHRSIHNSNKMMGHNDILNLDYNPSSISFDKSKEHKNQNYQYIIIIKQSIIGYSVQIQGISKKFKNRYDNKTNHTTKTRIIFLMT